MEPIYTATELAEVRAYHEPQYVALAADALVTPVVFAVLVRFATRPLAKVSSRWGDAIERTVNANVLRRVWGPGWVGALIFAWLFFGVLALFELPLTVWFGYFHEHAHGLSKASPAVFVADYVKSELVFSMSVGALVFGLFGLARRTPRWWLLLGVSAAALMLVATAIDPYRSRVYVDQTSLPDGPLRTRLLELLAKANVEVADVKVDHTASRTVRLQAYFAGKGPTRMIVLNDSLLSALSDDEVLAAVAHEAGHVHERRWPSDLAAALTLLAVLFGIEWLFQQSAKRRWFDISERADVRVLPLIALLFTLAVTATTPLSGAVSRQRELDADQFALGLIGDAATFRSMLVKAARTNKMDPEPPRWVVLRGMSHPPMAERLRALDSRGP